MLFISEGGEACVKKGRRREAGKWQYVVPCLTWQRRPSWAGEGVASLKKEEKAALIWLLSIRKRRLCLCEKRKLFYSGT
jgi:hypothetical protein